LEAKGWRRRGWERRFGVFWFFWIVSGQGRLR
jgi:hypothetical protein